MESSKSDLFIIWMKKIPRHIALCFWTGIITGLFTHMYMLTRKLVHWDEVNNIYGNGLTLPIGRWALDYTNDLAGRWSNPWLHGVFAIVMLSIAACFVVAALDLKKNTSAIIVAIIFLSFPSVASTMTFMWLVEDYAFAIALTCFGAYAVRKYKFGFIIGTLCFIFSLGIYQSYICFAAGILVLAAMVDLLEGKELKELLKGGVKYMLSLGAGMIGYIILAKAIAPHIDNHNGMATMGQVDIVQLPLMIMRAYKRILEYFVIKPFSFISSNMVLLNIVCCILIMLFSVLILKKAKVYKEKGKLILYLLLLVLLPLALASIYVMAPDANVSMLMLYQYCIFYVVVIVLWEKYIDIQNNDSIRMERVLTVITTICILLVGYQNYIVSNEGYFRMEISNERAKAYYNRILTNVEAKEGYQYGDKIVIMGEFFVKDHPNTNPLASYSLEDEKYFDFSGISLENGVLTSGARRNFMRLFLGADMPEVTVDETDEIQASQEFKDMPNYPDVDSIRKIGDIWVVKLCYDWETYQDSVLQK